MASQGYSAVLSAPEARASRACVLTLPVFNQLVLPLVQAGTFCLGNNVSRWNLRSLCNILHVCLSETFRAWT